MSRQNRNPDDGAQPQEDTDAGEIVARTPAVDIEARALAAPGGNILITEPGKGAAWVEAQPQSVCDVGDWR